MSDYKPPLNVLEFPRATLYTPAPGTDNERASLGWSLLNDNPRVTVWTRSDDKEKGPITAGIGHEALEGILSEARKLFESGQVDTLAFDNLTSLRADETSRSERVIKSSLMFGRDPDGICFISLISSDDSRPQIVFPFKGLEWHVGRRKSKPFTAAENSTIQAIAMVNYIGKCMSGAIRGQTREERQAMTEQRKARRDKSYQAKPGARTQPENDFSDRNFSF